ncbi:MAG: biopolymer transporter ExbD [Opitutaceae bacterium]|nr:biopolymer transporter ExbD [Opitutaceae bacterium]
MSGQSLVPPEVKKKARIEIIPLIDVIFFLLATFVLFTLSLDKIQSVDVQLPVASNVPGEKQDEEETVTLQVSDQGTCYWNKDLVNVTEIKALLQNHKTRFPNARVLITTDDKARFGIGVRVLDEVREAGIKQVSVETRVRSTGR